MKGAFTFIIPLLGIGVLQGLLLSYILIFFKKGNKKANLMLALVVFLYAGSIFTSFLVYSELYIYVPHLVLIFFPTEKLIYPAFYLYVVFLLQPKRGFKWYDVFHTIPALWLFYNMIPFYELSSSNKIKEIEQLWFGDTTTHIISLKDFIINSISSEPKLIYIISTIFFLKRAVTKLKKHTSNTFIEFIDWLQKFTRIFLYFLILLMMTNIISSSLDISPSKVEVMIHLVTTFFIHYIVFIAIKEPNKLFFVLDQEKSKLYKEKPTIEAEDSIAPLLTLMKDKKPYLDPDLKVHTLATMLDITPHSVSRLINQEQGVNFYTFINEYRINEFKKRVSSNKFNHLTLLGIAESVGFNSKSSFNRIFKKHTKMTPSEYVKLKKVSNPNIGTSSK